MDEPSSNQHSLFRSEGRQPKARVTVSERSVMEISLNKEALRELIQEVLAGRIALDEAEAARACGVSRHVLRDLRLSGQIQTRKLGRKVVYTREDLMRALGKTSEQVSRDDGRISGNHGARYE